MPRPNVEAERREQILRATCEVLADKGRHALRMTDVAKQAGVSSGMVHYYFDSKQAVLAAAFEYNFRGSLERRRLLLEVDDAPLQVLHDVLMSFLPTQETRLAWRVWAELWGEAARDADLRAVNETLYGEWRDLVTELVARAQAAGQAREGDPAVIANMIVAMTDGLATQVLIGSPAMPVERMREVLDRFLAESVTVR